MDKVTAVVLLTMLVSSDASARSREAAPGVVVVDDDPPLTVTRHPCCLRSRDYRPRTQFVMKMLRSVEDL
jgi:hypothetical protein